MLPPHYWCASHTLNLIASKDADKFLSSSSTSRSVYHSAFAKSSALWNKSSRSTVASDTIQEVVKRKLIVLTATRCNSYYDALVRVTENSLADLNDLCTKLELQCFSEREFNFLKEYVMVLKPLSKGLDKLQGEDNCFYGTHLPTSEAIILKITSLLPDLSSVTIGLAGALKIAIRHHFEKVFQNDAILI